jgi:hypothetical protein
MGMVEISLGLLLIALGIWGLFDEFYYVVDFLKGGIPLILMIVGLLSTLAGIIPPLKEIEKDE